MSSRRTEPGGGWRRQEFERAMADLLGAESSALLDTLAGEPSVGLRLNGLRLARDGERERVLAALPWRLEPVPWCPDGYVLDAGGSDMRPGMHPWHDAGVYYLQDPAAMAVAQALSPAPGERVLDLAAAPGGKSTHLAALQSGEGVLVCNDPHPARARSLLGNLERCGVDHAIVCHGDGERLARALPGWFDRVLLDAPCSGEGMLRKSEAARLAWSPRTVAACAARQGSLIEVAAACVRPGGTLAYSTCTFSRQENEDIVEAFLARHPEFAPLDVRLAGVSPALGRPGGAPFAATGAARIWPHRSPGEGHFVALLRREEAADSGHGGHDVGGPGAARGKARAGWARPGAELLRLWREHQEELSGGAGSNDGALDEDRLVAHGDKLMLAPREAPPLPGVHVLRLGLALGEVRREGRRARFVPAHASALAARAAWPSHDLELGDPRIGRFLAGEELEAAGTGGPDGWAVVRAGGFPLGWGRRRHGSVRSMLPTGLRRQAS